MSSKIDNISTTLSIYSDINCVVANRNKLEALSQWVLQQKDKHSFSYDDIARRSAGLLTRGTVNNVVLQRYAEVKDDTLRGLARAFGVEEKLVRDVLYGETVDAPPKTEERILTLPLPLWRNLEADAARCRRTVTEHLEALLAVYFEGIDVNVDQELLKKTRGRARITQPKDSTASAELPFVKARS